MKIALRVGFALVALVLMAGTTKAADVLTFEGLQDNEQILNYYNGGFGGNGSGPGPNFGITFGSDSLALISGAGGGSGNFSNSPPPGDTVAYFLSGPGDVMNVAAGFTTGFSFFYSDQVGFTGSVGVYSGLNGTGSLLASLTLPSTPNPYNVFVPVGVTFAGTSQSVVFSGSADYIAFDNITLGSATAGGSVPEPSSFILAGIGGLGVFLLRRRVMAKAA
jgi:hypothetical protein